MVGKKEVENKTVKSKMSSNGQFVECLLRPLIDGWESPVVVVVVELLPDEGVLVRGLRVGGGSP